MKNKLIQILIFVIFLSLVFKSNLILAEVSNAINTFINVLFPSIFPFYLISNILINYNFCETLNKYFSRITNFLFHTSNASNFVIIMSIFSGFPSGSKYITDLYKKNILSLDQANYLITFTHFSNPLFVMAVTKPIFNNIKISYLILFAHIFANIIIGIIIRPKEKEKKTNIELNITDSFSNILSNSIISSLKLLAIILGNTCFFFIVTKLIVSYIDLSPIQNILINGLFDITKGMNSITIISNNIFKAILSLTFLGFGGINIHMQVLNIIDNTNIKYKNFLLGRISQIGVSIIIFSIIYHFL